MATVPLQRPTEPSDSHAAGEGQKKRGWTMFMDAPIADLAQKAPPAQPVPELDPAQAVGASDKKGWTVFGEPSPMAGGTSVPEPTPSQPGVASAAVTGSEVPERGRTVMYTGTPPAPRPYGAEGAPRPYGAEGAPRPYGAEGAPRPYGAEGAPRPYEGPGVGEPPPSAAELARAAAAGQPAKTVVAQGMTAQTGPGGSLTGRTTAAGAGGQPDTMYFKRGQVEPEKPTQRPATARDLEPPASLRPIEERAPRTADLSSSPSAIHGATALDRGQPGPPAVASGGGSKVIYIVVGVVAVGAIATAAFFAFT
jgi:hypothetical protein